jgi:hypothetical protein
MAEVSLVHLLVKALDKSEVRFPATKAELVEKLQSVQLRTSEETAVDAAALVSSLEPDSYKSGAAFMCAVYNLLYQKLYEGYPER